MKIEHTILEVVPVIPAMFRAPLPLSHDSTLKAFRTIDEPMMMLECRGQEESGE
jgi:hypothetical protein